MKLRRIYLLVSALAATLSTAHAATWYLHADQAANWNTLADWWSTVEVTGTHPASISSADDFYANACQIRTPATSNAETFTGRSLTLNGAPLTIKSTSTTNTTTVGNFICHVGSIQNGSGNIQLVNLTNATIHDSLLLDTGLSTRGLNLTVGTLSGNGDITFWNNGTILLTVGSSPNYCGTMYVAGTTAVTFLNSFTSAGTLVVPSGARMTINSTVTFSGLTVNGVTRAAGTYTAASLGFTGAGSVVVRDPLAWYLHADQGSANNWHTLADWWSTPTAGSHPSAISANDDYFTNGRLLRTPSTSAASTFDGASLTIDGGRLLLKSTSSTTATTVRNLNTFGSGGSIQNGSGGVQILDVTNLDHTGANLILDTVANNRGINLSVQNLSGAGNLTLQAFGGGQLIWNVANAYKYTGTFTLSSSSPGTLTIDTPFITSGKLVVGAGNTVVVNQPVSLAGLTVGGVARAAGTYTPSSLGLGGTGTITVTNRPVQMFGVNESGLEFSSVLVPPDSSLAYYQTKGLTLIRLPFHWERIQPTLNGPLSASHLSQIQSVVTNARNRGMKVLLDLHNFGRYNDTVIGTGAVTYAAYQDVWTKLAAVFANDTAIWGYDIMNEPHGQGGTWPTAAQSAINGVRASDTTHFIVVEGEGYSAAEAWPKLNPGLINVTDPQRKLIFSAHCYFANTNDDQYGSYSGENAYPNKGMHLVAPFVEWCKARGVYGHIGEFGIPDNDTRWNEMMQNFLQYIDDHGISGSYWSGGPFWDPIYKLSCEPRSGVDRPQMSILQLFNNN